MAEALGLGGDAFEELLLGFLAEVAELADEGAGIAADGGEGGAHLVGGEGDELGAELLGRAALLLLFLEAVEPAADDDDDDDEGGDEVDGLGDGDQ